MNSFRLKWIAILTMAIDHTAAVLLPYDSTLYLVMRCIGRVAFPIFVFLLIEGFQHTSNVKKYLLRLGAFALISEVPFDLAIFGRVIEFSHQNIFFTLFIGLLSIYLIGIVEKTYYRKPALQILLNAGITIVFSCLAGFLKTDYDFGGVLLIIAFYLFRKSKLLLTLCLLIVAGVLFGGIEIYAVLGMIPIVFYNGKKGKSMKYFFYLFYPAHLLLLAAIHILI